MFILMDFSFQSFQHHHIENCQLAEDGSQTQHKFTKCSWFGSDVRTIPTAVNSNYQFDTTPGSKNGNPNTKNGVENGGNEGMTWKTKIPIKVATNGTTMDAITLKEMVIGVV